MIVPAPAVVALVIERAGERDDALDLYHRAQRIDPAITLDELGVAIQLAKSMLRASPALAVRRH